MATYKEIQNYVLEKYNVTVKTCWIAHVKEMCGILTSRAPNRIDANRRTNPCPMSKEGYIRDAFRHFGMI